MKFKTSVSPPPRNCRKLAAIEVEGVIFRTEPNVSIHCAAVGERDNIVPFEMYQCPHLTVPAIVSSSFDKSLPDCVLAAMPKSPPVIV